MVQTIEKPATYADLEAVPPHLVAEILFGELVTHPRPVRRHGGAASVLGMVLGGPFQLGNGGPGGWIFVVEPELHLGPPVAVPDIAGWRRERVTEPADKAFFEVAPDWLCEVLSPSTAGHDRVRKLAVYLRESVRHVWFIDPLAQTLEVLRLEGGKWFVAGNFADDAKVMAEPFEAVELELGLLWER